MKLVVLGPTGGTGKHIVSQALAAGHEVTAYARDRSKAGPAHPRLRVIEGGLHDSGPLADAMRGHDVVISALGRGYSFKSEHLMERSVPLIIAAMRSAAVRRLLFTSALGVGDSFSGSPVVAKLFFVTLLRGIYADKAIGDRIIAGSDLDWTIVRPSRMTDGPMTGNYLSGERLTVGSGTISRADVAHFLLQAAGDPRTVGKTLLISQ